MDGSLAAFGNVFNGRRVFLTGHTGFKGSWLASWLRRLGAEVTGYALPPETEPSMFAALELANNMRHIEGDITDFPKLARSLAESRAEIVLHLAAQPLVGRSYAEPRRTLEVNIGGTSNLLDAIRHSDTVKACLVVTSDKCYENREWERGYRESDAMGGHDPYSASKGAAEIVVASYRRSFFHTTASTRIASARAGNVIGGGDWSADRLVPDFIACILADRPLALRNPRATRPWQHVLEPLSGYLHLASLLWGEEGQSYAEGWNFGPREHSVLPVAELANLLCDTWGRGEVVLPLNPPPFHEAGLLKLDSSKAQLQLGWSPIWNVEAAVQATVAWYRGFSEGKSAVELTETQLDAYSEAAQSLRAIWTATQEAQRSWTNAKKKYAAKSSTLLAS